MSMATVKLPYVKAYADRHGKTRHYYRRKGFKTVTLPGKPGSVEFSKAHAEAVERAERPGRAVIEGPRSTGALIVEYYHSAEYLAKGEITKKTYRSELERFRREYGTNPVILIERHHVNAILHKMANRPAAMSNLRKRLRAVFQLGEDLGWIKKNPVGRGKRTGKVAKGFPAWSEDQIEAYEAYWPSGSRERLAFALLLYTGQRRQSVPIMGRQHVKDGRISVTQQKTKTRLWIPIHRSLEAELAQLSPGLTFLVTGYGVPFTVNGFGQWFSERVKMADIADRSAHGLRKSAAARLADAGCTSQEIMSITGHKSLSEVENYTRSADQKRLADSAMKKLRKARK